MMTITLRSIPTPGFMGLMVPACSLNSLGDEAGESLQSNNPTQAFVIKQDALSPPQKKNVEKSPHLYVIRMNLEVSES